ncbi:MAG: hypothetical protein ACK50A_07360 [Sphingobacteriaceae bacterium]|jgi:thiaminase
MTTLLHMQNVSKGLSIFEELQITYNGEIKCWRNNILTFQRSIIWAQEENEINKRRANHLKQLGETEAYQHYMNCLMPCTIMAIKRYHHFIDDCNKRIESNLQKVGECEKFMNGDKLV